MSDICFKYAIASFQVCKEPHFLNGVFEYWSSILEPKGVGTKYPLIFKKLYSGEVEVKHLQGMLKELEIIKPILKSTSTNFEEIRLLPHFRSCLIKEPKQIKCFNKGATNAFELFQSFLGGNLFEKILRYANAAYNANSNLLIINSPD